MSGSLSWGSGVLKQSGIAAHHREAEFLLSHSVGEDRAWILLNRDHSLLGCASEKFKALVDLRASGTPIQYLIGTAEFFGLELNVRRGVYIPKQETELVVEGVLKLLETPQHADLTWGQSLAKVLIHEIGTGSGAIAISIAMHAPDVEIEASDVSAFALSLARENSSLNGVDGQIQFRRGNLQDPLAGVPDLVVANLPYIEQMEDPNLSREVRAQPRSSLFSQNSGLGHITRLLERLILKPGGRVILEIGFDQAEGVRSVCAGNPKLVYERTIKDLAGLDRIAVIAAN